MPRYTVDFAGTATGFAAGLGLAFAAAFEQAGAGPDSICLCVRSAG
jgi:hypothetical protein